MSVPLSNKLEFLHISRQILVKKFAQDGKLRFATWKIGTHSGKGIQLLDTMIRRIMNIAC